MQKRLIGLTFLLVSKMSFANFPDIDKALYHPLREIEDISFELQAEDLTKVLNSKLLLELDPATNWKVYKYKEKEQIDFTSVKKIPSPLVLSIQKSFLAKASFAWLDSMKAYLRDFDFVRREGETYFYQDNEGESGIEELRLSFSKGQLNLEMDLIDQKEKHKYIYDRKAWSDSKLVLVSVESWVKKGSKITIADTDIEYERVSKALWLPYRIDVVTTQKSQTKTVGDIERSLKETYLFKNYKIDKKIAFEWFNSHNN